MQGPHLFEYAVIRIVPRVEREEFLNVGVIMLCAPLKFLGCKVTLDEARMKTLWPEIDMGLLLDHIQSFERISVGGNDAGPIGLLSMPERFRWLTASRSTIIQTSKVHPGLSTEPLATLGKLMKEHVI